MEEKLDAYMASFKTMAQRNFWSTMSLTIFQSAENHINFAPRVKVYRSLQKIERVYIKAQFQMITCIESKKCTRCQDESILSGTK